MKQARTENLTCVYRYHRASAILVAQETMAAFDTENSETGLRESGNEVCASDAGAPAHAAIVTR